MINEIREKIAAGLFEFSKHAVDQSILRGIGVQEVREAIKAGEIIEDYPNDKYGPTCLIFGMTADTGHCTFRAAIHHVRLLRSSRCTSRMKICG